MIITSIQHRRKEDGRLCTRCNTYRQAPKAPIIDSKESVNVTQTKGYIEAVKRSGAEMREK